MAPIDSMSRPVLTMIPFPESATMTDPRFLPSIAAIACAFLLAGPATAQTPDGAILLEVDDVEWTEIIPGVDFGAVYGEFTEEGHAKLVRFEPGLVSPLHTHTNAYHGVVVQGTVTNPYEGEDSPVEMGPGTYWYVPGGAAHKTGCVSEEPCLFYTHADEGWDIQVVEGDPAASR